MEQAAVNRRVLQGFKMEDAYSLSEISQCPLNKAEHYADCFAEVDPPRGFAQKAVYIPAKFVRLISGGTYNDIQAVIQVRGSGYLVAIQMEHLQLRSWSHGESPDPEEVAKFLKEQQITLRDRKVLTHNN